MWKEMIKSQAWKNSLEEGVAAVPNENTEVYYKASGPNLSTAEVSGLPVSEDEFEKKYHSLVSRAYYQIIAEAEKADKRLKAEYSRLRQEKRLHDGKQSKLYDANLALIDKRYKAHTEMLEGLKSGNIFSEFRSGDLDFFKADNQEAVFQMYDKGRSDESIINFLIFKLADLYHFEE